MTNDEIRNSIVLVLEEMKKKAETWEYRVWQLLLS